jgi:hypothetical protein
MSMTPLIGRTARRSVRTPSQETPQCAVPARVSASRHWEAWSGMRSADVSVSGPTMGIAAESLPSYLRRISRGGRFSRGWIHHGFQQSESHCGGSPRQRRSRLHRPAGFVATGSRQGTFGDSRAQSDNLRGSAHRLGLFSKEFTFPLGRFRGRRFASESLLHSSGHRCTNVSAERSGGTR